jgi:hypothetical protein
LPPSFGVDVVVVAPKAMAGCDDVVMVSVPRTKTQNPAVRSCPVPLMVRLL